MTLRHVSEGSVVFVSLHVHENLLQQQLNKT